MNSLRNVVPLINIKFTFEYNNIKGRSCLSSFSGTTGRYKKITDTPSQVLAIPEKEVDGEKYATVKHVAKGLNLNNLELTNEINTMIDLTKYVYKGK